MSIRTIGRSIWNNPGNRGRRIQKLFAAVAWQADKRLLNRRRSIRLANGIRFCAYPDCVISSALHYADWPEFNELQFCRRSLARGQVVIDVGANVGHFSLLLADVVGPENLICFEPSPVAWARLVENFRLNGWPTSRVYHSAVGSAQGVVDFPATDSPETTNSIAWNTKASVMTTVELITLDSIAEPLRRVSVGLLKIDVEGYETEVFEGSHHFLDAIRPRLILFESLGGRLDSKIKGILDRHDYEVFQLDSAGTPEVALLDAQNLFAVPQESASEFQLR